MSTEIDKRVVEMQFNNKDFEKNVQASLTTIDKLKMALNFDGAKGLDSITKAANKVDMSNIVDQTNQVRLSFSALQVAGATMVSEITKKFLNIGGSAIKNAWNASFGQMKSGGMSRALNIEMANFKMQALVEKMDQFAGKTEEAKKYMEEMDKAIDWAVTGTAYGYDAAASVASQLMSSNIHDIEQIKNDLRTIAGAAAMTGRSYENMGGIFAAVASQTKLTRDQLNQFAISGVNATATIAKYLNKTEAEILEMTTKGKIDYRTFADAMQEAFQESAGKADETFAGVTANVRAQLSRIGQIFAQPYIKNMIPLLQKVKNALKQFKNALVPTGERFDYIFGRLTNWASDIIDSLDFSRLETIVRGIENIFWGLASVLYTVHEAFEEVFSRKTLEDLNNSAIAFENFTKAILPTRETLDGIKVVAKSVMLAFSMIVNAVVKLTEVAKPLMYALIKITSAVITLVRHFKPIIDGITDIIKESKIFEALSLIITDIILRLVDVIIEFIGVFDNLLWQFMKVNAVKEFGNMLLDIYRIVSTLLTVIITLLGAAMMKLLSYLNIDSLSKVWTKFAGVLKSIGNFIGFIALGFIKLIRILLNASSIIEGIGQVFESIRDFVKSLFTGGDVDKGLNNVTDSASNLSNVFKGLIDKFKEVWSQLNVGRVILALFAFGVLALIFSVNGLINSFTNLVGAATKTVNSVTLIQSSISNVARNVAKFSGPTQFLIAFAIALGAFTSSVVTLTNEVDPKRLKEITPIIGVFIGGIIAAAAAMGWANKYFTKSVGLSVIAANMLAVSGSLLILTFAIKAMAGVTQDIGNLISVTASVILIMTGLAGSVAILSTIAPKFEASMISILAFSAGVFIVVKSLKQLEAIDISAIWRQTILLGGLMIALGTAIGLAGMAGSVYKKEEKTLFKRGGIGFTLLAFSISMLVLLKVLKEVCAMSTDDLQTGLKNLRNIMMSFMPLITVIAIASKIAGNGGMLVRDIASLFSSLSLALLVMFGAVLLFSKTMKPEELDRGIEAVRGLISSITYFLSTIMLIPLAISAITQKITGKYLNTGSATLKQLAGILIALGFLMVALSICTKVVGGTSEDDLLKVVTLLGVVGLITMGLEAAIGLTSGAKAGPILATLALVGAVVGSLAFIAAAVMTGGIDIGTLLVIAAGFSLLMASLGILFMGVGQMEKYSKAVPASAKPSTSKPINPQKPQSSGLKSVAIIFGIAAIFASLGLMMTYAAGMKWQQLAAVFGGLTVVILSLMAFVIVTNKSLGRHSAQKAASITMMIEPLVFAILGMVASFALITHVIKNDNTGSWAVSLLILASMLVIMGLVFQNLVKSANTIRASALNMEQTILALGSIAAVISELMLVVGIVMALPVNSVGLGEKIAMLVIVLAGFAGIIALSSNIDPGKVTAVAIAMLEMGAAFLLIAGAISLISSTPTDEQAGKKFVWLLVAFGAIAAAVAAAAIFLQTVNPYSLLAVSGAVAAMSLSLLIISAAMTQLGHLDKEIDIDKIGNIITKILGIFALLTILAGVVGATGIGTSVAIAIVAVGGAFLMFGLTLLATAKSFDIFVEALHKFAELSEDDINHIVNNIHLFLSSLPGIASDLLEFGPYLALIISTWITNIALAVGSAMGAISDAALALVVGFCNGIAAGMPTILDTLATVIREINDWIINNKDIWIDTGKAITIAVVGVMQGIVDGMFEYFGVKLDDLFQSARDAKNAIENNENVHRNASQRMRDSMVQYYDTLQSEEGTNYGRALYKWLDELQRRIDLGVITYEDALQAISDVGLDTYSDYIDKMGKFEGYFLEEDEIVKKQLESTATDAGKKLVSQLKDVALAAKEANDGVYSNESIITFLDGLNKGVGEGTISYRYALLQLYELGLQDYSSYLDASAYFDAGVETSEQIADGIREGNKDVEAAANETVDIIEDANDRASRATGGGGGSYALGNAAYAINKTNLQHMSAVQLDTLRDTFSNEANFEELGKGMAEDGGEAFTDEAEKNNWIERIGEIFKPAADVLGVDLGKLLSESMTKGLSSTDIVGMLGSVFTGEEYKTEGMWKEYYNEMVPIVKNIGGFNKTVGMQSRYLAEGYESLDQALAENSKTGRDYFDWMHGGVGGALDQINEAISGSIPDVSELTDGLTDLGDAADYATDYTDKLKESIEKSLDVFTAFNKEVKTTSREVLKNLYSQIEGVGKWSEELQALSQRGLNSNFLQQLAEEGPSSYDKIHTFYTMSERDLALFNTMYAEELVMREETAEDIRKSWLNAGMISQDEYDKFATDIGTKYDKAVLKAQQEAASKKNAQMSASTKKNLDGMYQEIEKYQADADFINKLRDNNAEIGEEGAKALTESMEESTKEGIIGTAAYVEAGKDMVEDISDGIKSSTSSIVNGMENIGKASVEALKKSLELETALSPINEFRKGVYQQVQSSLSLFDEVKVKTEEEQKEEQISTTQMLYNMAENTKKIGKWANDLKKLAARGMSEGLVESLRQLGPESADKVDAFVRMTDEELKRANRYFAASEETAGYVADKLTSTYAEQGFAVALGLKEGVNEGKDDLLAEMYKIGTESSEGFKNGIDPDAAKTAMEMLGNKSLEAICKILDINSPSRKMMDIGIWTVDGFVKGIGAGVKMVVKSSKEVATKALNTINESLSITKFKSIGENIVKGLNVGITGSMNIVDKAMTTLASRIMNGLTSPLKIKSPSQFAAYCAEMISLGFANEMNDDELMLDATKKKSEEIRDVISEEMLKINEAVVADSYNPVIRPVMDWSDVESGYESMSTTLGKTPLSIKGSINAAMNASKSGPSQDAIMITTAINNLAADQKAIRNEINNLRTDTVNLGNRISNMYVRLDGKTLVGEIVAPMDSAMGNKVIKQKRGRV